MRFSQVRITPAVAVIVLAGAVRSHAGAGHDIDVVRLPSTERVDVLAEGATLPQLVARAKPLGIWGNGSMVWVRDDAAGGVVFTLNRAVEVGKRSEVRHALVREKADDAYTEAFDGAYTWSEARLVHRAPLHDVEPSHALLFAQNAKGGALYRVRWATGPTTGSGQYHSLLDVFLLRRPGGEWAFVGEGAEVTQGRSTPGTYFLENVEYRVRWTDDPANPAALTATSSHEEGDSGGDARLAVERATLCALREGTLDPETKQMKWGEHEYVTARADGETLAHVARLAPSWRIGFYYEDRPDRRPAFERAAIELVVGLNPKSAAQGKLRKGERVLIPSYVELLDAMKGSPATQPAKRAAAPSR